jgi:hypothetical protein
MEFTVRLQEPPFSTLRVLKLLGWFPVTNGPLTYVWKHLKQMIKFSVVFFFNLAYHHPTAGIAMYGGRWSSNNSGFP